MQTAATGYDLVVDPAAYAGITLAETDDIPMDSIWHRDAMVFLIALVRSFFWGRHDIVTGGNNFIYFNPDQARNLDYRGPDFFFVKGVDRRRRRRYWAVWEEGGRTPNVVLKLLSPTTEREDRTTKFTIYEQTLRTPEYFLYDPDTRLLEGHRLLGQSYVRLQPNEHGRLWSEELGLWLGTWAGSFQGEPADTWLRLYTPAGDMVPLLEEEARQTAEQERRRTRQQRRRAEQAEQDKETERHRADQAEQDREAERRRADLAEQEVARLKALLQQQPPPQNDANP